MPVLRHCQGPDCCNFFAIPPSLAAKISPDGSPQIKCCGNDCRLRLFIPSLRQCPTCHDWFKPLNRKIKTIYCSPDCSHIGRRGKNCKLSQFQKQDVSQLYESGLSTCTLAKQFNTSENTIRRAITEHGVSMRITTVEPKWHHRVYVPKEELILFYQMGMATDHLAKYYAVSQSTIAKRLREFGVDIRNSKISGPRCIKTTDGHIVKSSAELMIDNWLYIHGIAHIYEPALPPNSHYHADFFACGFYIELWGHGPFPVKYRANMKKKLALYEAHHLPLISITWEQTLKDLDAVLAPLLD